MTEELRRAEAAHELIKQKEETIEAQRKHISDLRSTVRLLEEQLKHRR